MAPSVVFIEKNQIKVEKTS